MSKKNIALGVSDFKKLITQNGYFVDKSLFIKDIMNGASVYLFSRPRRFGKTLNLSMLKYFYDVTEDNATLFNSLKISEETDIMQKQGKHPVIFLTFKDVKKRNWKDGYEHIVAIITELFSEFRYLLMSDDIDEINKAFIQRILTNTASSLDYELSLKKLSQALFQHHKVNPVILIDEYDTPIQSGYLHNYYDAVIDFMRGFLSGALKDNNYLEKAVITGILRVAKESIFSGLNNISVCSISEYRAADKFGFTEEEVADLLKYYDDIFTLTEIRDWYDGYNFGEVEIYNPWSILSCIDKRRLTSHWVNTASSDLIKDLCLKADEGVRQDIDILTQGGTLKKEINDSIVFSDISSNPNALWSFLLHSGYLRYDNLDPSSQIADLRIPNKEITSVYKKEIVCNWLVKTYKMQEITRLTTNLISGDIEVFKSELTQYCLEALSYFDIRGEEPENSYHMFMMGMLSSIRDRYIVKSNRESGYGRYDIILLPQDIAQTPRGIIFELKRVDKTKGETFEWAIEEGKEQIIDNKYDVELRMHGVKEIVNIVLAFAGKEMRVEVF